MMTETEKQEIDELYTERDRVVAEIREDPARLTNVQMLARDCCRESDWHLGTAIRTLASLLPVSYQIAEVFVSEQFEDKADN